MSSNKFSLINIKGSPLKEGDTIIFEMPPFCSGDYSAEVKRDPDFGLYIDQKDNHFEGCRDFDIRRKDGTYWER